MQIEIKGAEWILEQLRLHLEDQFQKYGYSKGPKIGSMDAGVTIDYIKEEVIVSLHLSQEETEQCTLRVEAEQNVPELNDVWDDSLISFGRAFLQEIGSYAVDKDRVERELR